MRQNATRRQLLRTAETLLDGPKGFLPANSFCLAPKLDSAEVNASVAALNYTLKDIRILMMP
jgi:hypothetical protein